MRIYKKILSSFVLAFLISFVGLQGQNVHWEKVESFFPNWKSLQEDSILWGKLHVPEDWGALDGNQIKIAVARLKNRSNNENAEAMVFIQGGPGANSMWDMGFWQNHPVRKDNDIIILDLRGTGFSEPRLCPDLGKELFNILAKNQTEEEDEEEKTAAALSCKRELLDKGINPEAYNSLSVAKDLNALKTQLGYNQWHVFGVSYGTYMAQVYAATFPEDIATLMLDSSIDEIADYYDQNTINYMESLSKVFKLCTNDPDCSGQYPNLEQVYFKTIQDLEKDPITVSVKKDLIESEEFTYNAEDFKVAIQQALYQQQLIEVIPLLIYQFQDRNEEALGGLVAAFSSLLSMDYGVYFCVTCNEVMPNNTYSVYQENAKKYKKLGGGISFYHSDFKVCEKWNRNRNDTTLLHINVSNLVQMPFPVLVFSGEFDPITPSSNGEKIIKKFKNGQLIKAYSYGHVPSFSETGGELIQTFLSNPKQALDVNAFDKAGKIDLVKNVRINPGVSNMGSSLNQLNPLFIGPLSVALLLMSGFLFIFGVKLFKRKYTVLPDKVIRAMSVITSVAGILCLLGFVLALKEVAGQNFFILAFGLPESYNYLFISMTAFVLLLVFSFAYFFFRIKSITDRSIVFSVLFSQSIFVLYFLYWGLL